MKKRIAIVILLICLVAGAVILVINRKPSGTSASEPASDPAEIAAGEVVYVFYANTYLSINSDSVVCANSSQKPAGLPEVTGIEFTKLSYGKIAQVEDDSELDYVIKVAENLEKYGIMADRINCENRMVTIYIDDLEIELGKDEKTSDKLNDLSDFLDEIIGASGTLYMQNTNADIYGYTFREK